MSYTEWREFARAPLFMRGIVNESYGELDDNAIHNEQLPGFCKNFYDYFILILLTALHEVNVKTYPLRQNEMVI